MKTNVLFVMFFIGLLLNVYSQESKKPNVIYIMTDQMSAHMLSCTGNPYVSTPNLDALAASGIRFERAYTSNPVCVPSRYSMFTGQMPSRIGLEHNSQQNKINVPQKIIDDSMGHLFRKSGYETMYGGKTHLMGRNGIIDDAEMWGFDVLTDDFHEELAVKSVEYIKKKHDKPFLLVASFMNPHDICYMALNEYEQSQGRISNGGRFLSKALKIPNGFTEDQFVKEYCPPLPANFEIPREELSVFIADKPEFMKFARNEWKENDWRLHRWAYARLTELVDEKIGRLIKAVKDAGLEEDTIIVYSSDHGDQDSAHRLEHKAFLYEESTRVPFLVSWKGKIKQNQVDRQHLISSGLDLLPTICDLADVPYSQNLTGESIRSLAMKSDDNVNWRKYLVVENNLGRLMHMGRWKYMVGKDLNDTDFGAHLDKSNQIREMLIDLKSDPGEMVNLASLKQFNQQLEKGRKLLIKWYAKNDEKLENKYIIKN